MASIIGHENIQIRKRHPHQRGAHAKEQKEKVLLPMGNGVSHRHMPDMSSLCDKPGCRGICQSIIHEGRNLLEKSRVEGDLEWTYEELKK